MNHRPMQQRLALLGAVFVLALTSARCRALTIDLAFEPSSPFTTNSTARATINKAASDISSAITSSLSPVNTWEWTRSNTSSGQTLTITRQWYHSYVGANGNSVNVDNDLAAHHVQIYVRGADLSGNTLGTGTTGTIGFDGPNPSISASGSLHKGVLQNQFTALTNQHSTLAQNEFIRGNSPIIGTANGTSSIDTAAIPGSPDATADWSVSYGPSYGTLALDSTPSSGKAFSQYWHLDYATNVAAGKNDLYSVALHEMLHVLGYGASQTWNDLANGTTWTGEEAIDEYGTGANLVTASHVRQGVMSHRITDGAMQEVAMDPNITTGQRKYLTTLDLALLRDLGYTTIVPDFSLPGDFNGDGMVDLADYTVWRDNLGAATEDALNGNGNQMGGIDADDFDIWKVHFGNAVATSPASSSALVSEPATSSMVWLLTLASLLTKYRRRARSSCSPRELRLT